jgi:aminodeoxyfutalosine deaminase
MVLTYFYGYCSSSIFTKVCKGNYFNASMIYRKLRANALFTGYEMLSSAEVLIISEEGQVQDIVPSLEAGEGVEFLNGILSPGLVNCHCHLELSHLKACMPEKTGLVDFVFSVVTQRHFPESAILDAIAHAENDMISNGIVAVGDICNNLMTIPQKQLGRLAYYNFIEVSGWLPNLAEARFEKSRSFYDAFDQLSPAMSQQSISPHAPYSVSEALWKLIIPFFPGKTISMHNQETEWEEELFRKGTGDAIRMYQMMKFENPLFKPTGKTSLQTCMPWLKDSKNILLVHNTFIRKEDLEYCKASSFLHNLNFCLCPNANLYIENRLPPIDLLREYKFPIVLGTDSLASNHALNILEEIKTIHRHYPEIPLAEMLGWATLNGAKALQLANKFGSFEKGKKPGVILIENTDGTLLREESVVRKVV